MSFFTRFRKTTRASHPQPPVTPSVAVSPPKASDSRSARPEAEHLVWVIRRPLITERTTALSSLGKFTFEVASDANKLMVKRAIGERYGVKPVAVNLMNVGGKVVRFGCTHGRQKSWKKAIVTLKPGETIKDFSQI